MFKTNGMKPDALALLIYPPVGGPVQRSAKPANVDALKYIPL